MREPGPTFNPAGLDEWLKAQDKKFSNEAREIVGDVEEFLKEDIRQRLEDEHGSDWERSGSHEGPAERLPIEPPRRTSISLRPST